MTKHRHHRNHQRHTSKRRDEPKLSVYCWSTRRRLCAPLAEASFMVRVIGRSWRSKNWFSIGPWSSSHKTQGEGRDLEHCQESSCNMQCIGKLDGANDGLPLLRYYLSLNDPVPAVQALARDLDIPVIPIVSMPPLQVILEQSPDLMTVFGECSRLPSQTWGAKSN